MTKTLFTTSLTLTLTWLHIGRTLGEKISDREQSLHTRKLYVREISVVSNQPLELMHHYRAKRSMPQVRKLE